MGSDLPKNLAAMAIWRMNQQNNNSQSLSLFLSFSLSLCCNKYSFREPRLSSECCPGGKQQTDDVSSAQPPSAVHNLDHFALLWYCHPNPKVFQAYSITFPPLHLRYLQVFGPGRSSHIIYPVKMNNLSLGLQNPRLNTPP